MPENTGQGPENQSTEDNSEAQSTEDQESTQDNESQDDDQDTDSEESKDQTISKSEYDKLFNRMQAADRAKSDAEKRLKSIEEKDMSELEKTKSQLKTATDEREGLADQLKKVLIENAFHRDNKYSWHDVSDAISALDMSGVEITDDGKVTGMSDAIKDVAKRKPHFVKTENPPPAATGANNGQRKGEKGESSDRNALLQRFPALGK